MTNSPTTLELGHETLLIEKMNLAVGGELRNWMTKRVKELRNPIRDILSKIEGMSPEIQKLAIQEAAKATVSGSVTDDERNEALVSPEGCQMLVFLLAKRHQPDLTLEKVRDLITANNYLLIWQKVSEAANLVGWIKEMASKNAASS